MTITSGCPEALTKIVVGITKTDVAFVFLPFPLKRKLTWCTVSVIVHTYTTLSPIDSLPTTHCCFFLIVNPSDNGSSKSWQRKKQKKKNEKCPATGRPYVYTPSGDWQVTWRESVCVCGLERESFIQLAVRNGTYFFLNLCWKLKGNAHFYEPIFEGGTSNNNSNNKKCWISCSFSESLVIIELNENSVHLHQAFSQ